MNPQHRGTIPQVSRFFFKDVVHAVLIFGLETWVVTSHMVRALGGGLVPGGNTADRVAPAEET